MFVQAAIAAATTLEEVERLNRLLQTGQVPGRDDVRNGTVQQTGNLHTPYIHEYVILMAIF